MVSVFIKTVECSEVKEEPGEEEDPLAGDRLGCKRRNHENLTSLKT